MREMDLNGLADEIGDSARQPHFATVERRAGRLRGQRYMAVASGVLAVVAALSVGGYAIARPHTPPQQVEITPTPAPERPERIMWAGAGDADHLYALVIDCLDCPWRLMASSDRGRTWLERPAYATLPGGSDGSLPLSVLGPRVLAHGLHSALDDVAGQPKVSLDGGVTWRDQRVSTVPVPRAPAGTQLQTCRKDDPQSPCGLFAVDPATGVFAPLADQPPLASAQALQVPPAAGLWAQGYDPASDRPAVAVSRDDGRTWDVGVLTAEPANPAHDGMAGPLVVTTDGQTAYATFFGGEGQPGRIHRSTDGGKTWTHTNVDGSPAGLPVLTTAAYVTADGAHVVGNTEGDTFVLYDSPDGRQYARLPAPKIGEPPVAIDRDTFLLRNDHEIWLSSDGRTWQPTTPPWRR